MKTKKHLEQELELNLKVMKDLVIKAESENRAMNDIEKTEFNKLYHQRNYLQKGLDSLYRNKTKSLIDWDKKEFYKNFNINSCPDPKEECDHYFPFGYDKATDTMIYDNPCEFCGAPSPYKNKTYKKPQMKSDISRLEHLSSVLKILDIDLKIKTLDTIITISDLIMIRGGSATIQEIENIKKEIDQIYRPKDRS